MARQRRASLSLVMLLLLGAAPLAFAADEPAVPFSDPQPAHDDAHARLVLRYKFAMDLDQRIKRAANDAALSYYRGDLKDYRRVAGYLVETQYIPRDANDTNPRRGAWKGDNLSWETFDEGNLGRSIAVLAMMIDRYGNGWKFRNNNGQLRTMGDALRDALDCAYRNQFKPEDGGIAGPWPQSPGWRNGEAKWDFLAGLRTYNDACTSEIVDAMGVVRILLGDDEGRIDDSILLCAEGTWQIAVANNYSIPEQCEADGTPAWGRGHEPPALSSRSTAYAVEIFMVAHALTGDQVWLDRSERLYAWLERKEIRSGQWEHYFEPGSERLIWGDGDFNIVRHRSRAKWPTSTFGSLEIHPARIRTRLINYEHELEDFVSQEVPSDEEEQIEPEPEEPPIEEVQEEVQQKTLKPTSIIRTSGGNQRRRGG